MVSRTNQQYFANDAFVAKFAPSGTNLIYSTFLGGTNNDMASYHIACDAAGNAYVTGWTVSPNFPRSPCAQTLLQLVGDKCVRRCITATPMLF
jgi:hypothetical protein